MRKYYIDNIRSLCILLLFPFHTCMIYNGFESFYIHGDIVRACNDFIWITYLWFMPILFLLAGMSAHLALEKRTWKEYLNERFYKLFLPLFFGIVLTVPIQTYYAEKFHNNYQGGFFEQYKLFFTKTTDLTGYTGGFTPGHLWFLLFLFVISLLALPLMIKLKKSNRTIISWFSTPIRVVFLFVFPFILSGVLDIAGKSIGQFFAFFFLGYLMSREDGIFKMVENNKLLYLVLSVISLGTYYTIIYTCNWETWSFLVNNLFSAFRHLSMWVIILTVLGYAKKYFNQANKTTAYLRNASFALYIFHQTWLVLIAYYVFKITNNFLVQFITIMLLSLFVSVFTYEIFKRTPVTRFLFGIKKNKPLIMKECFQKIG